MGCVREGHCLVAACIPYFVLAIDIVHEAVMCPQSCLVN